MSQTPCQHVPSVEWGKTEQWEKTWILIYVNISDQCKLNMSDYEHVLKVTQDPRKGDLGLFL